MCSRRTMTQSSSHSSIDTPNSLDIRHVYIRARTPHLNVKVARSHRVDDQEFCQLLGRNGISDDIRMFNQKLREWDRRRTSGASSFGRAPAILSNPRICLQRPEGGSKEKGRHYRRVKTTLAELPLPMWTLSSVAASQSIASAPEMSSRRHSVRRKRPDHRHHIRTEVLYSTAAARAQTRPWPIVVPFRYLRRRPSSRPSAR